jgi:hypothetical protein
MAEESFQIRAAINLVELLNKTLVEAPQQPWGVSRTDIFEASLKALLPTFADLAEKLVKFIDVKLQNPLTMKYGKHDSPMTGPGMLIYETMPC